MLKHSRPTVAVVMAAFVLVLAVLSIQAANIPSGVVAVFPDKEPVRDDDLGPPGSGSVDDDNSNLTIDFGFHVPASPATPTPEVTPLAPGPASTPIPSGTPVVAGLEGVRFGKRREEVGLRKPCVVIPAEIEKPWFITDIAMYAASEMHHTSQPFIQWSQENGLTVEQTVLKPTGVREFGAEVREFSVNNVHSVISNAGIGLHLERSPVLVKAAEAANITPEAYVERLFEHFAERANLRTIPENIHPVFLEYAEGDPRYMTVQNVNDWRTLQWETQSFNTHLIPSAFGQTLLRQALLIEEFLATNHAPDGTPDVDGAFAGVSDVKGFLGLLAAEEVVHKLWFMDQYLKRGAENLRPGTPGFYFPYQTVVDPKTLASESPDIRVIDEGSRLFDQLSLLWGLSEIMLLTDTRASASYRQTFSTDILLPGNGAQTVSAESVHALAQKLAGEVFETVLNFHTIAGVDALIESFPGTCDDQIPRACTYDINMTHLGLSVPALVRYYQAMQGDSDAQLRISRLVRRVADVLAQSVADAEQNGVFEISTVRVAENTREIDADDDSRTLTAQMTTIRGLLAAYQLTGEARYREHAFALYDVVEALFWDEDLSIYRDRQTRSAYRYTPFTLGATVGALRELVYAADSSILAVHVTNRMRTFTRQIAKYAGLQLSELALGAGEDFLIPVGGMSAIRPMKRFNSPFGLAPVLNSEVRLHREAIIALHAERPTDACDQARTSLRSTYYYTDVGMYAASELARSQTALAQTLAAHGLSAAGAKNRNPELFDPVAGDTIGAKSQDFSDYNLIHVLTKSSLGVGLQYGPVMTREAEAQGMEPEVYLTALLQRYAQLTGLENVPENLHPIFLEFEGGVPEIEEQERWYESNMDKSLIPSALGQTLVRQVLWLQNVLPVRHDARNRISPSGEYVGRNAEEGFLGLLIAQEVANKLAALNETLQVPVPEESSVNTPSGVYIPHRFEIDFNGERPERFAVRDERSYLFDQASLLWGVSEFLGLLQNPRIDVFGPGNLISGDYADLANTLMRRLLDNLEALHWNADAQTFFDIQTFSPQAVDSIISTHTAAFAIMALESVARNAADQSMQARAEQLLVKQAEFMLRMLVRPEDGAISNGATLAEDVQPFGGLKTLVAHAAAIRSFVIAYSVSGNEAYRQQAQQTFRFMEATFWDETLQVYRSAIGGSQYRYTPLNSGMTVGALQALLLLSDAETLPVINEHLAKFFERIIERIGLQLSEQRYFLEASGDIKLLAPVIAADLLIQPVGSDVDVDIPQAGSTLLYVVELTEAALRCDAAAAYVEDILPDGLTFIRSVPAPVAYDGQVIRWSVADLVPDEDGVYRVRLEVQVDPLGFTQLALLGGVAAEWLADEREWRLNNCAQLSCQAPGEAGQLAYSDCAATDIQRPLLGLEKSLRSVTAEPGREAQFEIVVANLSEVTAYTVTIEDQLPAGLTYVEDSARSLDTVLIGLDDIQPLVWVLEDLEPQQSIRLTYTVFIDPKVPDDVYTTTVKVHAMDRAGFPFESNEFVYDFSVERALLIDVDQRLAEADGPSQILSGKTFTVVTQLDNVGSDALQAGGLRVTLPQGVEYIAGSSRLNNTILPDPVRENSAWLWRFGELPVKGQAILQYTVRSPEPLGAGAQIATRIEGTSVSGESYQSRVYRFDLPVIR